MEVDRAGDWLRGLRPQAWIRVPGEGLARSLLLLEPATSAVT